MQMRDVTIRMNAEMGKADAFKRFQAEAKQTATLLDKMSTSLKQMGGVAEQAADKATRAWDRFQRTVQKTMTTAALAERRLSGIGAFGGLTGGGAGGGAGAAGGGVGMAGMAGGLLGKVGLGGGIVAAGGMLAKDMIGTGLNSAHAAAAGVPLQRSDLGFFSGMASNLYDWGTGREFQQRRLDQDLEKSRSAAESKRTRERHQRGQWSEEDRLKRLTVINPNIPGLRPQDDASIAAGQARVYGRNAQLVTENFNRATTEGNRMPAMVPGARVAGMAPGGNVPMVANTRAIDANLQKRLGYSEEITDSLSKQLGLLKEQRSILISVNQAQVSRLGGMREQWASMDDGTRDRTISLGQKLRAGGLLNQDEHAEAMGNPLVRDLMLRKQMEADQLSGSFNEAVRATGRPEDLPALERARVMTMQRRGAQEGAVGAITGGLPFGAVNVKGLDPVPVHVEVAITMETDSLVQKLTEDIKQVMNVESVSVKVIEELKQKIQEFERKRRDNRDNAFQGPN